MMTTKTVENSRHLVGIGFPVDYNGRQWTVSAITRKQVVMVAVDNQSLVTRVDIKVFERGCIKPQRRKYEGFYP